MQYPLDVPGSIHVFQTWGPSYKIEFDIIIKRYPEGDPNKKYKVFAFTPDQQSDEWELPGLYFMQKGFWVSIKHYINDTFIIGKPTVIAYKHIKKIELNHNYHIGKCRFHRHSSRGKIKYIL